MNPLLATVHVTADNHADAKSPQTTHRCQISAGPVYTARHATAQTDGQMDSNTAFVPLITV